MNFNKTFIAGTIEEAVDFTATRLSQNFALQTMADKGSCSIEEAQNMYELAHLLLTEGSEDLIPETLELPDATDDTDPMAAQDAAVDADVNSSEDGDLNLDDLEGIILPDSEGNQYIIQGGILVPYEEEDDNTGSGGDPMLDEGDDEDENEPKDEEVAESTLTENTESTEDQSSQKEAIEETTFNSHSSIIANLIKNTQFN